MMRAKGLRGFVIFFQKNDDWSDVIADLKAHVRPLCVRHVSLLPFLEALREHGRVLSYHCFDTLYIKSGIRYVAKLTRAKDAPDSHALVFDLGTYERAVRLNQPKSWWSATTDACVVGVTVLLVVALLTRLKCLPIL